MLLVLTGAQAARAPAAAPLPGGQLPRAAADAAADEHVRHLRSIAKILVSVETRHRTQVAELERLTRVFEEQSQPALARLAIQARHAERHDYDERMRLFEQQLGPELYARFRAAMDAGPGSEPALRPIPPEPPPPPPLTPGEEEAQQNEKRAKSRGEDGG